MAWATSSTAGVMAGLSTAAPSQQSHTSHPSQACLRCLSSLLAYAYDNRRRIERQEHLRLW